MKLKALIAILVLIYPSYADQNITQEALAPRKPFFRQKPNTEQKIKFVIYAGLVAVIHTHPDWGTSLKECSWQFWLGHFHVPETKTFYALTLLAINYSLFVHSAYRFMDAYMKRGPEFRGGDAFIIPKRLIEYMLGEDA